MLLLVNAGFAQMAVTPASRHALREQIVEAPAVELNPRTVNRAFIEQADLTIDRDVVAPAATGPDTTVVGVADLFGEGRSRAFTVPLLFEVLEAALADPSKVELRETSPPFERIKVTSSVIGQPATLRIASNFSREGVVVEVPVEPTLLVSIVGGDLRAYGMQTTSVRVTAIGGGEETPSRVMFTAPGAILMDEEELTFDEHRIAEAKLRTDRLGV
jgi:hypothetical protein